MSKLNLCESHIDTGNPKEICITCLLNMQQRLQQVLAAFQESEAAYVSVLELVDWLNYIERGDG